MALKVQAGGTLTDSAELAVPNRYQALLKRKKEAGLSAREETLRRATAELAALGGPGKSFA